MSMTMDADDDARYGAAQPRRYYGKYAGLVTDNGPPPDGGSHRGQVKVKVPGILEETPDGNEHQPLEVLAYPAFLPGFFFVPDNEAPVWVEFVAGDINFPIWTGVWYPDDKTPKATSPTSPGQQGDAPTLDQKIIRSKTDSGQVIQLDDTSGSAQTVISDEANGNLITLDQNGINITASAAGMSVTLTFGQTTVVVKDKTITLTAGQDQVVTLDDDGHQISLADNTNHNKITLDSNGITLQTSGVKVIIGSSTMDVGSA
jgi:hypothetical protein